MDAIEILEDAHGAPDGIHVQQYREGETYKVPSPDMSESLAETAVAAGWAEPVSGSDAGGGGGPSDEQAAEAPEQAAEETTDEGEGQAPAPTGEWGIEPTSEGSPYYQFRQPNGELLTGGDGEVVTILGEEKAEDKLDELKS